MSGEMLATLVLLVLGIGFVAVMWMAIQSERRIREMEHRERLAMIERGLIPSPELEALLFDRGARWLLSGTRSRSLGVILIGIGLGLILLLAFAGGAPESGIGIGGALAVLGAAFYVNGYLSTRQAPRSQGGRPGESPRVEPGSSSATGHESDRTAEPHTPPRS